MDFNATLAMDFPFNLKAIDHVAIRVKDFESTIAWYSKVLGLKKVQPKEWQPYPVFMMIAHFGVALFPAVKEGLNLSDTPKNIKIDHFAFTVSNNDFNKARRYFESINEAYEFQDHQYYHSIYLRDPDGHKVELTTLVRGFIN